MEEHTNHIMPDKGCGFAGGVRVRIAIIISIAFIVRLGYLWGHLKSPFFTHFFLDPKWHHEWAQKLAAGDWVGDEVFFRAPLYPYFLGLIYKITGSSLVAARVAQFALGSLSSALVYLIGRKLFSKDLHAFIAGVAFALYGPMIYFEGELLIPSLIVFLDLAALLLLYIAWQKNAATLYALTGLLFGLSAIARPNVLVPVMGLAMWIVVEGDGPYLKKVIRKAAPLLLAFCILPVLVTVRNGLVGGDFVFVSSQGGVNFYIGNNPLADGKTIKGLERKFTAPKEGYHDNVHIESTNVAEHKAGHKLKPSEVSSFWFRKAFKWMSSNPIDSARLFGRKLFYLISGHELPSNNVPYFCRRYSSVLSVLMWERVISFPAGILIPLSLIGMALAFPRRRTWAPLYIFAILYAMTIWLFFVTGRYRMPIVGLLILFAVEGVRQIAVMRSEKRWKGIIPVGVCLAIMMFLSNVNLFKVKNDQLSRTIMTVGNYHLAKDELDKAAGYYNEVLGVYPNHPSVLKKMGVIAFKRKDYASAEKYFRRTVELEPNRPGLHNLLGKMIEARRDFSGAELEYMRALALDPNYTEAEKNLRRVRKKKQAMLPKHP